MKKNYYTFLMFFLWFLSIKKKKFQILANATIHGLIETLRSWIYVLTVEIINPCKRQHHWCVYWWVSVCPCEDGGCLSGKLWFSKIRATWLLSSWLWWLGHRWQRVMDRKTYGFDIQIRGIRSSDASPQRALTKAVCGPDCLLESSGLCFCHFVETSLI